MFFLLLSLALRSNESIFCFHAHFVRRLLQLSPFFVQSSTINMFHLKPSERKRKDWCHVVDLIIHFWNWMLLKPFYAMHKHIKQNNSLFWTEHWKQSPSKWIQLNCRLVHTSEIINHMLPIRKHRDFIHKSGACRQFYSHSHGLITVAIRFCRSFFGNFPSAFNSTIQRL